MSKRIISIYYTDSSCKHIILNDGSKEYVNKQINFYGLESEINNKVNNLVKDSSVKISHAIIH